MTSLELRAVLYATFAVLLIALGVRLGMRHVEAQWNIQKLSDAAAMQKAQADLATALVERNNLQNQVEQAHAQLIQNGAALTGTLSDSMRNVETALRAYAVRTAVASTGGTSGTGTVAGSDPAINQAIANVEGAITALSGACIHDSAELTSILALSPK